MSKELTPRLLLGFKHFFPNETPHSKEFYALKLGKEMIEKLVSFFLSLLGYPGKHDVDNSLKEWFTFYGFKYDESPSYLQIEAEYRRIKNYNQDEKFSLLSPESLLNMFLWVRSNNRIPATIQNNDASMTLYSFELVLLFNDDVLKNYEKALNSTVQYNDNRKIQRSILAQSFSQHDLVNIDYAQLTYTQFYKLDKLLIFLETNENSKKYSNLLDRLLYQFGCSTKEEFFKAVYNAIIPPIKTNKPSWKVLSLAHSKNKAKSKQILDNLALIGDEVDNNEQDDYLSLRAKPFQKISEDEYRIIFELFLIKKV